MLPGRHGGRGGLEGVSGGRSRYSRRLFPLSGMISTLHNIDETIAGPSQPCVVVPL